MQVVIDSNILFKVLISQGEIIKLVFNSELEILTPLKLKEEFNKHKKEIFLKSKTTKEKFELFSSLVFKRITFVPLEEYESYIPKAKELLGKHIKDIDFVALAVSKDIKLWTYENLLFKIGIAVSTKQISDTLK
ncbi:MAG: PIN domain-containing protein [Candidatus Aenigmarchaeota archaeon]|nr:PIN domain-containing protein [Candidatus Aenigmarchaeota archaeon]